MMEETQVSVNDESYDYDSFDENSDERPTERWAPLGAAAVSPAPSQTETSHYAQNDQLRQLEEEQEQLNSSLLALTTHFAHVQFRLKQIVSAPPDDKEILLQELEEFAFRGIPDARLCLDKKLEEVQEEMSDQEHEQKLIEQREKQRELIEQLKKQLEELETYAYETGDADVVPTSKVMEKQKVVIDELKHKLDLNLEGFDSLSTDQLKQIVDHAVGEIVNPGKVKEKLIQQLSTQITDLERFIQFLQGEAKSPGPLGKERCTCTVHKFPSGDCSDTSSKDCKVRDRNTNKHNKKNVKETKAFIKKSIELLQMFLISQFGCGGRDFQRNLLKKTTKGNHWGSPASLHEAQDNGDGIQCKRTDSVSPASLHEVQDNGDGIQCKRTDGVLPSTSLPELNTQDPVNITSGVKRTFCSDHAYCTSTCNSFNEQVPDIETALDSDDDIDSEDDIDNGVKSVLDAVKGVNLTPSSRYDFQSILKSLTIDELPKINIFLEILKEMKERCPDLLYEMMNVSVKNPSVVKIRNITSVVLAYSALMFSRNNKNSAFQRCTTLMAVAGNASDEFIRRLNQMGISLSCTSKLRILEKAGETSKNLLVEKLKTNPRMKITGDNLDMYIKTNHQRQDNDNKDIHWFASNAFLSRLDYTGLSLEKPNVPLGDISPEFFIPNNAEKSKLRDVKKVLIGRMIVDKKDFDWLEKKLPTHIPHRYSEYMSKKQEVFSLPIIFKNESKNEDCLDIMDAYERQLTEIFTLAHGNTDMLQKHGAVLGGDQLTRERLQNVKNIRFLALTPEGRFEHLNPIVIEHWHVKQDLLSKAYKALYTAESLCTPGTLFHAKTILRRQDVTGNVKSNYKAHEDLFLLMVKALLHVAADQIQVQDNEDRDYILSQLYSKVHGEEHDAQDQVMNYFINVIEWGLLIINMNDTAKEGDFERLEVNCKAGIGFLLGHSVFSKYFGELVNYLLLTKHLLSPEMSLRALEGAFINTKGGPGKNKEADLVQEHCIRNKKDLIRSLGANKTEKAVMRACGAADTCVGVGRTVDGCLGLPKLSVNHTKKSSVKDLEILVKCLKTVDPFTYHKGRNLKSFCNIRKHPDRIINMEEMLNLIRKKVRKFFIDHS